jgi:hypothetical protein
VADELVVWVCRSPEAELFDAGTIEWRAARGYGLDAFVPAPLRRERPAALHLVGVTTDGALVHLGRAHLAAYGHSGHESHGEARFALLERVPRALWLRLGGFGGIRLESSGVREDVAAAAVRSAAAGVLAGSGAGELWLRRWTGATLTVLYEPERAFVMRLSGPDDAGSVACDPARGGDRRPVAFTLGNGQVDTWPLEATISREQALDVMAGWAVERHSGPLVWTDDPPTL